MTSARDRSQAGLWLWLGACLGWLLGVAWQLLAARSLPQGWHGVAMGCAVVLVALLVPTALLTRGGMARPWRMAVLVLWPLAMALAGWGTTGWRAARLLAQTWPVHLLKQDVSVVVRLEGLPQPVPSPAGTRWRLDAAVDGWDDVRAQPGMSLPERLTLYADWPSPMAPRAGQRWRMRVRLHPPDGLANPGASSGTLAAFGRGVRAIGQVRPGAGSLQALADVRPLGVQDRIDRWRQAIREAIAQRVPEVREAGVLAGLSVGDQAAIAPADWDVLRRTGVAHLVSISGAHVAMLGSLCAALARRLWSRCQRLCRLLPAPTAAGWVAVAGAAAYALLSGGGVPAQRTVWTLAAMTALRTLGRAWPWPLVWLLCAVAVTVLDPFALAQAGFWLSFVAVAVLMSAGAKPVDVQLAKGSAAVRTRAWLRAEAMAMWRTQRLVSLALMPLSLVCFQQVSLVGMVANLWAVPVFGGLITPLALAGVVWPGAWDLAAACTGLAFKALQVLSATPVAVWGSPSPPLWVAVLAVLASFALAMPGPWRWRSLAMPFLLPLLCLPEPWRVLPRPAQGQFAAIALDVGQGTAVLVRTAHHQLLFDTGASVPAGGDMGARVVLPVLQALGVCRLDTLLISHQDNDHVGGALSVVQGVPVALLRSSLPATHPLLQWAGPAGHPLPHQPCVAGQSWQWDGVRFELLHPTAEDLAHRQALSTNALSCVLRVAAASAPAQSLLLTGDIEAAQERALLSRSASGQLRSTVLVVPHHGSSTSSTPAFLAAVEPQQAVVQAGRRNRYGHPSPGVLARYAAQGVHTELTPACGAWLWQSDGSMGQGQCWRALHPHLWDSLPAGDAP